MPYNSLAKTFLLSLVFIILSACGSNGNTTNFDKSVQLGKKVFKNNCVICHGSVGQGLVKNWKKPLSNGKYPPPPLNGSAHTWHHSPKTLLRTINEGGAKFGGAMPGFSNKLDNKEGQALVYYLYSLWPKDIQYKYNKHFKIWQKKLF